DIDALAVVRSLDRLTPCRAACLDRRVGAARKRKGAFRVARCRPDHPGAQMFPDLDRRIAGGAPGPEDQQRLVRLQPSAVDKRVPGGGIAYGEYRRFVE